jgi:hypothetical protein
MDGNEEIDAPIVFDGLESALIGFGSQWSRPKIAVYSARKIIEEFVRQGMTEEEAIENFDYNVLTLWAGPLTPLIIDDEEDDNDLA